MDSGQEERRRFVTAAHIFHRTNEVSSAGRLTAASDCRFHLKSVIYRKAEAVPATGAEMKKQRMTEVESRRSETDAVSRKSSNLLFFW